MFDDIVEIERNLIGNIISYPANRVLNKCLLFLLGPENFSDNLTKDIYSTMLKINSLEKPIDIFSVRHEYLERISKMQDKDKQFEKKSAMLFSLSRLESDTIHWATPEYYIAIIIQESIKRETLKKAKHLTEQGIDDSLEYIEEMEKYISKVNNQLSHRPAVELRDVSLSAFNSILKIRMGEVTWIKSFYPKLDDLIGGFFKGDYIIIAARPGVGKTSFALNLIKNQIDKGLRVVLFSFEMTPESIFNKMLSLYTGIDAFKIRTGNLNDTEIEEIQKARQIMDDKKLMIINDTMNIHNIAAKIDNLIFDYKPHIIYFDYLQLILYDEKKSEYENITAISKQFKVMAKKHNIPLIVIHQLNRDVENRKDKRPKLSDLKASGQTEQDIDLGIFIYRADYWMEKENLADRSYCEILIEKQRQGATGHIDLSFHRATSLFSEDMTNCYMPSPNMMIALKENQF